MISLSCLRLVALAIGAVTLGRAISQASDICAGVADGGGHRVERLQDAKPRASRKSLMRAPAARFPRYRLRAVFAGEEAGGERIIGDDADPLAAQSASLSQLESLAVVEIIKRLQAFVARQAEPRAGGERCLEPRGADIRRADGAHLALRDQLRIGLQGLFRRGFGSSKWVW